MPGAKLPLGQLILSGVWGAFVAPVLLMLGQAVTVVFILAAAAQIHVDNPDFELDPDLESAISAYMEESGRQRPETNSRDRRSADRSLALFSVVAIIAPLSEELVKAAGAIWSCRGARSVTRADAFLAAVASGLGFALF